MIDGPAGAPDAQLGSGHHAIVVAQPLVTGA
jgi:hypothetical protein